MSSVQNLPPDLLAQVLLRVPTPDIRILSLVQQSWHEAASLESNPIVWGRLIMARPGVMIKAILNAKVEILGLSSSIMYRCSTIFLL
jgi:hypothetical protein